MGSTMLHRVDLRWWHLLMRVAVGGGGGGGGAGSGGCW